MKQKLWFILALVCSVSAFASIAPNNVFVLFEDGGEHPAACSPEHLPTGLTQLADWVGVEGYLGSVQVEWADRNEAGIDAFKHAFVSSEPCEASARRLNEKYGH